MEQSKKKKITNIKIQSIISYRKGHIGMYEVYNNVYTMD
jgi:hypothetical protein